MRSAEFLGDLVKHGAHLERIGQVGSNDERCDALELLTGMAGDGSDFVALAGELFRSGKTCIASAAEQKKDWTRSGRHR